MNTKRWIVVALAIILVVASSLSAIGLEQVNTDDLTASFSDLFKEEASEHIVESGDPDQRILRINIEGAIGENSPDYSQELTLQATELIREDPSIKAVLLSFDTPGGSVYLTREVYDLFMEIKAETGRPVYASMGSMAASAGYYLATMADEIYATPETLTGSIGVILSGANVEELYDKIGVDPFVIKSGELKDMGSGARPMTDEEEEIFQSYIDESFDRFVQVVVDGRQMDEGRVRELADGRIYTAQQALDNGLIDGIQYERDVIEKIKADIGVEEAEVFELQADPLSLSSQFPFSFGSFFKGSDKSELEKTLDTIEDQAKIRLEYRWEGA